MSVFLLIPPHCVISQALGEGEGEGEGDPNSGSGEGGAEEEGGDAAHWHIVLYGLSVAHDLKAELLQCPT